MGKVWEVIFLRQTALQCQYLSGGRWRMNDFSETSIKGYDLRERIGAGGFGAVYKAYQSTVGREVAVKIILPHFANHPDFIRRFETEAQLVARLEHPHITSLYDSSPVNTTRNPHRGVLAQHIRCSSQCAGSIHN